MSEMEYVNEVEFTQYLMQDDRPVIVEFGADWCAPCKRMRPLIQGWVDQLNGKARFIEVNVDDSTALAMKYQVMSVPTLILMVEGVVRGRLTGLQPLERIAAEFGPFINP
jgi:thioredoxin 1